MKSFTNYFQQTPKKFLVSLLALLVLATPLTVFAAWGPDRPTFDYNAPASNRGSLTGPVFNSFTNAPQYGDERNFVTTSRGGAADWRDAVDTQGNQEVEFRAYIHNNANETTNASGLGVARNTRIRFYVPEGQQAKAFDVAGYVSADNATPKRVYDTARVASQAQQAFSLDYVEGSARLYNNGPFAGGVVLPDEVAGQNGALIGFDALNGNLPGCFQYKAVVIIKVKVKTPTPPPTPTPPTPPAPVQPQAAPPAPAPVAAPAPKVTAIPDTGVAGILSGVLGTSATAYSLYAWAGSRRSFIKTLHQK